MNTSEVISAARRTERARSELLAEFVHCDFGDAFHNAEFAGIHEANMLQDAWLDTLDSDAVFDATEAMYAAQNTRCCAWMPATIQPIDVIESLLLPRGWKRRDLTATYFSNAWLFDETPSETLRILPARAMPRAYRATFADGVASSGVSANAAFARLDNASFNAFVAMRGDEPLGRAAYLEVGDIARVMDIHVMAAARRQGAGRALIAHMLQIARRLLPRIVVACPPQESSAAMGFLTHCGFVASGTIPQFIRPTE